jgi:AraC-like DNA-binding protein
MSCLFVVRHGPFIYTAAVAAAGPESDRTETFLTFPPESELCVQYTGEERCAPGHLWQGIRNHFLVHVVLSGTGRVMSAGGVQRLSAGDGFLFFPGQRCWYQADARRPWTYAWVGFGGTRADAVVRALGLTERHTVWHARPDAELQRCLRQLVRLAPEAPARSLRLTGLLYMLLDRIGSRIVPSDGGGEREASGPIARAFRFVELHYGQRIGVPDMARHAGLERTYFSTVFRKSTGQTPAAYLLACRMAHAEDLLSGTDLSVKETAASVGYDDYFVFAKRFKKVHGCTPGAYRQRARGRAPAPPPSRRR